MILSPGAFVWFCTGMVIFLCTANTIRDSIVLIRLLRHRQHSRHDKDLLFGAVMGLVMCAIGFGGVIVFHYF